MAMSATLQGSEPIARDSIGELSPSALGISINEFLGPRVPIEDVTVAHAGQAIARNLYAQSRIVDPRRRRQVVSRPKVAEQLAAGRTVVVRNVDLHAESCARLAAHLECQEGARVNCNLFVTREGFRGFALHWDAYDTIVVQLEGIKRWRIFDPGLMPPDAQALSHDEEHQAGEPIDELQLAPGDILFMRSRVPHQAVAERGLSCHINFTVIRPALADGLREVMKLAGMTEVGRQLLPPSYAERPEEVTDLLATTLRDLAADPQLLSTAVQKLHAAELGDHREPQADLDQRQDEAR